MTKQVVLLKDLYQVKVANAVKLRTSPFAKDGNSKRLRRKFKFFGQRLKAKRKMPINLNLTALASVLALPNCFVLKPVTIPFAAKPPMRPRNHRP